MSRMSNYPEFVKERMSPNHVLLHVGIGLVGEWYEYCTSSNKLDKIEELGDLCFYLQAGCNYFNIPVDITLPTPRRTVLQYDVNDVLHRFLDHVKKQEIYGNPQPILHGLYIELYDKLTNFIDSEGTILHIVNDNMHKLSKRYKSTFTPQEAEARLDKE